MIVVRLLGGLGNQMFQYSAARALALRHGVPLKLDLTFLLDRTPRPGHPFRGYDLEIFAIRASAASRSEVPPLFRRRGTGRAGLEIDKVRQRIVPHHGTERHYHFDARLLEAGPNTYLEGFWQSPRYFEGCEEAIREEFTFKEPMPPRILELCRQLRDADSVCINVRRGDFVGNHFHGTMPVEYYTKALSFVTPQYRDPKVFVFSDDIEWCRQQFTLPFETTFMDHSFAGPKFSHYLALMTACKSFVIPNSSFAWWAAWLADAKGKIVVAPKAWFLEPTRDTRDLIPRTWIRI